MFFSVLLLELTTDDVPQFTGKLAHCYSSYFSLSQAGLKFIHLDFYSVGGLQSPEFRCSVSEFLNRPHTDSSVCMCQTRLMRLKPLYLRVLNNQQDTQIPVLALWKRSKTNPVQFPHVEQGSTISRSLFTVTLSVWQKENVSSRGTGAHL